MNIQIPICGGGKNKRETKLLRGKTKRICELLGYTYDGSCWAHYGDGDDTPAAFLPNGCLIFEQVVGILKDLGWEWRWHAKPLIDSGWVNTRKLAPIIVDNAGNFFQMPTLIVAMDTLIGVLEKETK